MDTGSNGGVLIERSLAKKQKWLDHYATMQGIGVGVNSTGDIQRSNFSGTDRVRRRQRKAEGLLGYDVLKHYVVTIDYKSGYVHIEPGSSSLVGN